MKKTNSTKRKYSRISLDGSVQPSSETTETTSTNSKVTTTDNKTQAESVPDNIDESTAETSNNNNESRSVIISMLESEAKKLGGIKIEGSLTKEQWIKEYIKLAEYCKFISNEHLKLNNFIKKSKVISMKQFNPTW